MMQYAGVSIDKSMEVCSSQHPLCVGVAFEASLAHEPTNCCLESSMSSAVIQTYSMGGAYSVPTATPEAAPKNPHTFPVTDGYFTSLVDTTISLEISYNTIQVLWISVWSNAFLTVPNAWV